MLDARTALRSDQACGPSGAVGCTTSSRTRLCGGSANGFVGSGRGGPSRIAVLEVVPSPLHIFGALSSEWSRPIRCDARRGFTGNGRCWAWRSRNAPCPGSYEGSAERPARRGRPLCATIMAQRCPWTSSAHRASQIGDGFGLRKDVARDPTRSNEKHSRPAARLPCVRIKALTQGCP
jgi:hypothetical protein